ncbi:hypothetical protein BD310DRAFT_920431 [Dichomitus squalens]|uniref:Uncharacterized protein n=1 Tax=Dichomitus squalens TaxID=114155 RepID=A0A4Q9Q4V1_9APHY|nr:hypothetical protein BD310DRAFT_920431 [Dichomitus squalens]
MDARAYNVSVLYHLDRASCAAPPLKKHSHMVIGFYSTETEALSFALEDGADHGTHALMAILHEGTSMANDQPSYATSGCAQAAKVVPYGILWDLLLISITVVRTTQQYASGSGRHLVSLLPLFLLYALSTLRGQNGRHLCSLTICCTEHVSSLHDSNLP